MTMLWRARSVLRTRSKVFPAWHARLDAKPPRPRRRRNTRTNTGLRPCQRAPFGLYGSDGKSEILMQMPPHGQDFQRCACGWSMIAYNLGNLWAAARVLVPLRLWSLTSLQRQLVEPADG